MSRRDDARTRRSEGFYPRPAAVWALYDWSAGAGVGNIALDPPRSPLSSRGSALSTACSSLRASSTCKPPARIFRQLWGCPHGGPKAARQTESGCSALTGVMVSAKDCLLGQSERKQLPVFLHRLFDLVAVESRLCKLIRQPGVCRPACR
jgi:hypothetical protein